MATIEEFEQKIWELEGIRVIVRGAENTQVQSYNYKNAVSGGWSTTKWLSSRVLPKLDGNEVIVIQGNGEEPNGRTLVRNVKDSYHQ
jgi:hypothetical protein|tara:strand:- start:1802 stop:2062 length:261 start_codon:yes stop_codon:yes gene_type:complete